MDFLGVKFKGIKEMWIGQNVPEAFPLGQVQSVCVRGSRACVWKMTLEAEFLNDPVSSHWLRRIYGCLMPTPRLTESSLWKVVLST